MASADRANSTCGQAPPRAKPACPNFSSGPCAKRPGWSLAALEGALLGRSHRAREPKARLKEVIDRSAALLGLPDGWRLAIVPASDTGAVEMAMWSLLGPRPVDILAFETFSATWADDAERLDLPGLRILRAPFGQLPDLGALDPSHDLVLAWNGTTSGVRIPHPEALPTQRDGLVICDATSAAFAMPLPWDRLDVVTWSWQKALGGEAAHGMLALSPRAADRLRTFRPDRPLPKVFRLARDGALDEGLFRGETINTPSMLCVEDALDALRWAERIGGVPAMAARSQRNLQVIADWVERTPWVEFLAADPATRSSTSICLVLPQADGGAGRRIAELLEREGVAYDIAAHRDAPPGLRIWGGATVEADDVAALLPWIDWAYAQSVPKAQAA